MRYATTQVNSNMEFISVIDLLHSVQIKTDFLESFKHYSIQNVRTQKLDSNLLFASIVGYGCNISLSKMAKISKGISENQLDNATTWYLSEENTIESNDKIISTLFGTDYFLVKTVPKVRGC